MRLGGLMLLWLVACSDDVPPAVDAQPRWACPAGWVAFAEGGCGPASLLCEEGGGAEAGACEGVVMPPPAWPAETWMPDVPAEEPDPGAACPEDWMRDPRGACDPALRADCPAGASPLPGGSCTRTADADCPPGDWPDVAAEAAGAPIVRVRQAADPFMADGSEARPFATLAEGAAAAGPGGWVLVAAGELGGSLRVESDLHVVGACAARVHIDSPGTEPIVLATGTGAALDLRGVTLGGGGNGVVAEAGAHATLDAVRIDGATGRGIYVTGTGSMVSARDVAITGVRTDADGSRGRGVQASMGGTLDAARIAVVDCHDVGAIALEDGTIRLTDALVRGTTAPAGDVGSGFTVAGIFEATRAVVEDTHGLGLRVYDAGRLVTTDVVVRRMMPAADGTYGRGVDVFDGGTFDATRLLVDGAIGFGIFVNAGSSASLDGVQLRSTRGIALAAFAEDAATRDAAVDARDLRIDGAIRLGLHAFGDGARIVVDGAVVRDIVPDATGFPAKGAHAESGGRIELSHGLITRVAGVGFAATVTGSARLADVSIRDVSTIIDGSWGQGLTAFGGHVQADRVRVERVSTAGVIVTGSGTLELRDSIVLAVAPVWTDLFGVLEPKWGWGLGAQLGGSLLAERVLIAEATEGGVVAAGDGASIELTDVAVLRTRDRIALGVGIGVQRGARVVARRVLIEDAHEVGVVAYHEADTVLEDVVIRRVVPSGTAGERLGLGIAIFGSATTRLDRVAITDVRGAGIAAGVLETTDSVVGGGVIDARDLFVTSVRSSGVRFRLDAAAGEPGRNAAYGLHAATGCTVDAERFVLSGGGYGFFSAGTMTLRQGLVDGQTDAAGARANAAAATLDGVALRSNARDEVLDDGTLPEAAALEAPTSVCVDEAGCS